MTQNTKKHNQLERHLNQLVANSSQDALCAFEHTPLSDLSQGLVKLKENLTQDILTNLMVKDAHFKDPNAYSEHKEVVELGVDKSIKNLLKTPILSLSEAMDVLQVDLINEVTDELAKKMLGNHYLQIMKQDQSLDTQPKRNQDRMLCQIG